MRLGYRGSLLGDPGFRSAVPKCILFFDASLRLVGEV